MSTTSRAVTTVFGIGHLRPAPGTWASAAALPLGYLLHATTGPIGLGTATLMLFALGWWATTVELQGATDQDPSEIVVDEIVGQWLSLLPVSFGFWQAGLDPWNFPWPGWVGAFLMFRLFDVWKPGPVGWADRKGGAFGVMLDDVIAGILAGMAVMLAAGLYHGVLMR